MSKKLHAYSIKSSCYYFIVISPLTPDFHSLAVEFQDLGFVGLFCGWIACSKNNVQVIAKLK